MAFCSSTKAEPVSPPFWIKTALAGQTVLLETPKDNAVFKATSASLLAWLRRQHGAESHHVGIEVCHKAKAESVNQSNTRPMAQRAFSSLEPRSRPRCQVYLYNYTYMDRRARSV